MMTSEIEYFSRRMREERDAASRAIPIASAIHNQLAEKYASVIAAYEKTGRPRG
jgi:hypothetical protein